jgi:hypothetical protein
MAPEPGAGTRIEREIFYFELSDNEQKFTKVKKFYKSF